MSNDELLAGLTRPIIGMGNRTSQEVFDIMADRIRQAITRTPLPGRPYGPAWAQYAAPGDNQEDRWLLRFADTERREAMFSGEDAEREAWEAWNRYAPAWNCWLFRLAPLPASAEARATELLARLEEIDGNAAGAFTLRSPGGALGHVFEAKLRAVIDAFTNGGAK